MPQRTPAHAATTAFCLAALIPAAALLTACSGSPDATRGADVDSSATLAISIDHTPSTAREYETHIRTLADAEVMTGRLPGTDGIERAAEYIEDHFRSLGLKPAFPEIVVTEDSVVVTDGGTFRQPFEVNGGARLEFETLRARSDAGSPVAFEPGTDFNTLGYGGSGEASGPLAFIGYSVDSGPDGYSSFATADGALDDLSGHVVMLFRFEPHNEAGASAWADTGWTPAASLAPKFNTAVQRGAEAIIMVTPPGVDDTRADELLSIKTTGWSSPITDVPIVHMTPEAADRLLEAAGAAEWIGDLFAAANDLDTPSARVFTGSTVTIDAQLDRSPITTDNVGAILPGQGRLAREYVVIGGHYDHVGFGPYGTRRPNEMHPGADDNASGTSGVLAAATLLEDLYADLPDSVQARSILFLLFTAEESGLNGSRYYAQNPIASIDRHRVMLNLDMIGTYGDGQGLELGAIDSGDRLRDIFDEALDASGLDIRPDSGIGRGRSDHANFDNVGVPNVFLFTGLTDWYHTPDDTIATIDIEGGSRIASLAADMALAAALDQGELNHVETTPARRSLGGPLNIRVRVGIAPETYAAEGGIVVGQVYDDTSAARAGIREGDRIISWGGEEVTTVESWMPMLAGHNPGDEVDVVVVRDGEEVTITMELQGGRQDG